MLDIIRQDITPKNLRTIHLSQNEELAGLTYMGPKTLYHELLDRHANAGELLAHDKGALAFEVMYGIALGIDGLQTGWGAQRSGDLGSDKDGDDD